MIVAIDGPAGVGKTTLASLLARRLGVPYLSTGAMYRTVALACLQQDIDLDDESAVARMLVGIDLELEVDASGECLVLLDGAPVGDRIRTPEVDAATSRVAVHPLVRRWLVERQRDFGHRHGAVLEGRDIGTVVFPDTPLKFFLDAPIGIRARRRFEQLLESGSQVELREIELEMVERDRRDRARKASPLRRDSSYRVIDASRATPGELVEQIVDLIEGCLHKDH